MNNPLVTEATAAGIDAALDKLRQTVAANKTGLRERYDRLRRARVMLVDGRDELADALARDLGKSNVESILTETGLVVGEIDRLRALIRRSARRKRVRVPLVLQPARAWTRVEPFGVALVIAPWNYPVNLTLAPLVGALAAGNVVLLKPSELAPATSAALARLIPRYFRPGEVSVIEGGVDTSTKLLERRFDLVVYTGSTRVGRIVAEAAAKHLTPTILELGGKSPVWVDDTVNLDLAARRIVWGKLMNVGQTCVAPDYVLGLESLEKPLAAALEHAIVEQYGTDPQESAAYGRIITAEKAQRLREMAGLPDAPSDDPRYVPPVILTGDRVHAAMAEEIFGPILPIVTVRDAHAVSDAIAFIRAREKPLALYVFSEERETRRRFERETSSGAIGFCVPNAHLLVTDLPFGGVGESGMGGYHGPWSLASFSHRKAVLSKPLRPDTLALVRPPFGRAAELLAKLLSR